MSGCVIIGGQRARGVTFDGTNDYLTRASALSGIVNADVGTLSFWLKVASDANAMTIFGIASAGSIRMNVRRLASGSSNVLSITLNRTTAPISLATMTSTGGITTSDGWVHVLAAWDISASAFQVYIDDADESNSVKDRNGDVTYDGGDVYVGETPVGASNMFAGDLADFWFDPTAYMDISSSANRRKFISATGQPVYLGSTGERPTGASPILFLRGPAAGFHTNRGTGGDFSVTGALTNSATNPP
jgi:hypothetical protein